MARSTEKDITGFLEKSACDKAFSDFFSFCLRPLWSVAFLILSLLYEAYGDANRIDDDQIKADFAELYQALNGMPLQEMDWIINLVCALCRDHERNGFVHGVQLGAQLAQKIQSD